MIFEAMGKSFTLKYDFNAICAIEERAGKGFDELVGQKIGIHLATRYLLWGGLLKHNKNITLEETGAIIENLSENGKTFVDVVQMIFDQLIKDGFLGKQKESNESEGSPVEGEQKPEKE